MERRPSIERPLWVKLGLWAVPNRAFAWAFFWLSITLALVFFVFGYWGPFFFFLGVLFVLVALWYWLAIRWIDQHGGWRKQRLTH